ncbi:MAG: type III polyketide synthase [Bacteroidetes bacterium]|nr:MAG: type III polyketide synthase [Bacteroidota bacterium]
MKPCITAIGIANPVYRTSQDKIAEFMIRAHQMKGKAKNRLLALYRATGIKYRYSVLKDYGSPPADFQFYEPNFTPFPGTAKRNEIYRKEALPLAVAAIKDCLPARINKQLITHLITVSCTGLYAPGLDIELVETLGLPSDTRRTGINYMGCYAAFNALKMAKAICESATDAKVLIVCVELCSLHFQKDSTPDFMLSNALFGDGAAAVLIENSGGVSGLELVGDHCTVVPESNSEMSWQIGDSGFEMVLSQNVPDLIKRHIPQLTNELLARHRWQLSDIDYFAIHPGGKGIITSIQQALGTTAYDSRFPLKILRDYGNMSSATILFVLKEIWNNLNSSDHGKKVLCFAFGPGLTLESMILRITKTS